MRDEQNRESKRDRNQEEKRGNEEGGKTAHKSRPGKKPSQIRSYRAESNSAAKGFGRTAGVTRSAADSGKSHSQGGDVSQGVQIYGIVRITNPETFLAGSLEAGVAAFAFGAQCISPLEAGAFPVNGKRARCRPSAGQS